MLALILAAAITQQMDAMAQRFLRQCDRPQPTELCGAYLSGFMDSTAAHLTVAAHLRSGLAVAACLPPEIDMHRVRAAAVAKVRVRPKDQPHYVALFDALTEVYPCPTKSPTGTGARSR